MRSSTKSVDDPPTCRPMLAPPTEYIAGVDHLPLKFAPPRQSNGPRPPLPPTPKPNFFTSGRISTQSAFDNTSGEMSLLLSMSCNTRLACRSVSSSFFLSAANAVDISSNTYGRRQRKAVLVVQRPVFVDAVRCMSLFSFRLILRVVIRFMAL